MERRAAGLAGYYQRALAKYDRLYHGTTGEQVGPLVSLLQSYGKLEGLVVGPWGNGSKDLHDLVRALAESKVARMARSRGRECSEHELGVVTGRIRRSLSLAFVRAQALCLQNRIANLGEGARDAARRREQLRVEEERRRRDQLAHHLAHVRGRGVPWAGQALWR